MAPQLRKNLAKSAMTIFKGDVSSRKLVRDATWPYTTPFASALAPRGSGGGPGRAPEMFIHA
ncbi:hypothetical protein jhhlp_007953 [Lomentospora prolificans]|uniref:Damage-control phosphatase ARMT1-like metal-binding domain-containing protein n=1 Tax=Lomentospora prolificans TaxID=41688 RepID=A0A2N3MZT5_9PEZI|nr:hypothetical protein jhhlp_007953 [Lomentospora prolificans]